MMRRIAAAAAVITLLAAAAPAGAQPQRSSQRPSAAVPITMGVGDHDSSGVREHHTRKTGETITAHDVLARVSARADQSFGRSGATPAVDAGLRHDGAGGDLDGDGRADVLTTSYDDAAALTLRARRGLDGAELWTRTLPGGRAEPAAVGRSARGGAYVYDYPADDRGWRFTAVDAEGAIAWQREIKATPASTPVSSGRLGVVYDFWFVDAVEGPATDLLVTLWNYQDTAAGFVGSVDARIYDGATGDLAMTTTHTSLDGEPEITPISDVDGDGLVDLVAAVYDYQGRGSLALRSGVTGAPLWHNPDVQLSWGYTTFQAAGDIDGDRREDILVSHVWPEDDAVYHSGSVFDGATGRWRFSVGGLAYPLGDTQGDGTTDIGVLRAQYDDEAFGAWLVVYDGRGAEIRRDGEVFPSSEVMQGAASAEIVGDVDADGVMDGSFTVWARMFNGDTVETDGVVAGRTGEVLWRGRDTLPLWTTVDGRGDDNALLVHHYSGEHDTQVRIVDGATGQALWTAAVDGRHSTWDKVDLDGDGGAELVLIDQYAADSGLTVLRSSDGHVMWRD